MGNCIKSASKDKRRNKSSSSLFTKNPDLSRSNISILVSSHSVAVDDVTIEDLERDELEQEAVRSCSTVQTLYRFPSVSSNVVEGCKSFAQRSVVELPPAMTSLSKGKEKEKQQKHHVTRRAIEIEPMNTIPEQRVQKLVTHSEEDERYPSFLNPRVRSSVNCPPIPDENMPQTISPTGTQHPRGPLDCQVEPND